jgi:hypothetical protein
MRRNGDGIRVVDGRIGRGQVQDDVGQRIDRGDKNWSRYDVEVEWGIRKQVDVGDEPLIPTTSRSVLLHLAMLLTRQSTSRGRAGKSAGRGHQNALRCDLDDNQNPMIVGQRRRRR